MWENTDIWILHIVGVLDHGKFKILLTLNDQKKEVLFRWHQNPEKLCIDWTMIIGLQWVKAAIVDSIAAERLSSVYLSAKTIIGSIWRKIWFILFTFFYQGRSHAAAHSQSVSAERLTLQCLGLLRRLLRLRRTPPASGLPGAEAAAFLGSEVMRAVRINIGLYLGGEAKTSSSQKHLCSPSHVTRLIFFSLIYLFS